MAACYGTGTLESTALAPRYPTAAGACPTSYSMPPTMANLPPTLPVPSSVRLEPGSVPLPSSVQLEPGSLTTSALALQPKPLLAPVPIGSQLAPAGLQGMTSGLPPAGACAVVAGETVTMPGQPSRLTVGMVTLEDVAAQRHEYTRSLDEQQHQGEQLLAQQVVQQREHLKVQAEQQKVLAMGRWDQHLRAQELLAEREYQQQLASLREAAAQQRAVLEEQAAQLVMEYNARKTQQEINKRNYELQIRQWEAQQQQRQQQLLGLDLSRTTKDELRLQVQRAMQQVGSVRRHEGHLPDLPLDSWVPETSLNFGPGHSYQLEPQRFHGDQ